jgi:hypothetical protein
MHTNIETRESSSQIIKKGCWLVIWWVDLVNIYISYLEVTTALSLIKNSQIPTEYTRSSQYVNAFTSRWLVAASTGAPIPSSVFFKCYSPQLLASHSKSLKDRMSVFL